MHNNFLRRLIRIVSAVVIAVLLSATCLYSLVMIRFFSDNVKDSTVSQCYRLTDAMDIVLDQAIYHTYRFVLDNNTLYQTVVEARTYKSRMVNIMDMLNEALLSSRFYESVCLYSRKDDWVIAVTAGDQRIYTTQAFPVEYGDDEILNKLVEGASCVLEPRLVTRKSGAQAVVCPVLVPVSYAGSAHADCMLITYVDIGSIFKQVFNGASAPSGADAYIASKEGTLLVALNKALCGMPLSSLGYDQYSQNAYISLLRGESVCCEAVGESSFGWNVHMYQLDRPTLFGRMNPLTVLYIVVAAGIFLILASYLVLRRSMKPMTALMRTAFEHALKEQMLSPGLPAGQTLAFRHANYMLVLAQFPESETERAASFFSDRFLPSDPMERYVVALHKGATAILFAFDGGAEPPPETLESARAQLEAAIGAKAYFAVSAPRQGALTLAEAYRETQMLLAYSMRNRAARVLSSGDLPSTAESGEYPKNIEYALINNMLVGNREACREMLRSFVTWLYDDCVLQNQTMLSYITRLQSASLARAATIPLRLPDDIERHFDMWNSREEIEEGLLRFTDAVILCVENREAEKQQNLEMSIREYIQKNFADPEFCTSAICDRFSISRSQLTRLFKEKIGNTFNEYINDLRIETARGLLLDSRLTINAIANQVGFTYPHYFIKVFKMREGITPGQYREHMENPPPEDASGDDRNEKTE